LSVRRQSYQEPSLRALQKITAAPMDTYDHLRGEVSAAREQRKLAAILATEVVGYSRTVKGISPSLVSTSVIVLTCQYN
jgi:hypothetical protein